MFMTQEFKDQNTVLLDGRLICRHFLFGRCIKASFYIQYINIYLHVKVTAKIETRLIILAFIECWFNSQCNTLVLRSSLYDTGS